MEDDTDIAGNHADLSYWANSLEDLGDFLAAASLWEEAANTAHNDAKDAMDYLLIREATEYSILEFYCLEQKVRCLSMAAELEHAEAEAFLDADANVDEFLRGFGAMDLFDD